MTSTHTPIDLTVADRIAKGWVQQRWLEDMLTPAGLDLTGGNGYGRVWRRIQAFVDNLALAGYTTHEISVVPGYVVRIVITGYVPAAVPLLAAIRANTGKSMSARYQSVSHCELLAWVEHTSPEVVSAATTIAPWFRGSLENLLAVAPGIAQGQTLRATPQ